MIILYTLSDTLVETGLMVVSAHTHVHSEDGQPPYHIRQQFSRKWVGSDAELMIPGDAMVKNQSGKPTLAAYEDLDEARKVARLLHDTFVPVAINNFLVDLLEGITV